MWRGFLLVFVAWLVVVPVTIGADSEDEQVEWSNDVGALSEAPLVGQAPSQRVWRDEQRSVTRAAEADIFRPPIR